MEDSQILREMGEMNARLAGLEAKFDAMTQRIDDVVVTQVKDHGKRLAVVEQKQSYLMGYLMGAGAVGGIVATMVQNFMK